MPGILSVGRLLGGSILGGAFSPLSLFAANEPGGWYDPSDLTTLYQDAAGTTPVTAVEQPVGLELDKSRGLVLGSELVTNGDFSNGTTGWAPSPAATISVSSGELLLTNLGTQYGIAYQAVTTVIGKTYKATCSIRIGTAPELYFFTSLTAGGSAVPGYVTVTASGTYSFVFTASATTTYIQVGNLNTTNGTGYFDNISVRELPGNHLSQSTAAARPVLSARVNLLTYTEQFDNAAWNKTVGGALNSVTPNTTTAPNGTSTADTLSFMTGASKWMGYEPDIQLLAGVAYTFSIWLKRKSGSSQIKLNVNPYAFSWVDVAVTSEWQQFSITQTPSSTTTPAQTCGILADNSSGDEIYIWGADLRPANAGVGLPAYQRVGAATDYDTTGFPLYLKFDGTDDVLVSNSINPGSIDKAQVFAGVRKLSDSPAYALLAETSTSSPGTNGAWGLFLSNNSATPSGYVVGVRASSQYDKRTGAFPSPYSAVLAMTSDLAGTASEQSTLRVNGVNQSLTVDAGTNAGTGNYTSQPLYVGRRGINNTLQANMQLYSLILRFSAANLDAATITATETWVNGKTKAF